jgi:hypothetical protein
MRSGVGIGLVGIVLVVVFLLFLAVKLDEIALYVVCGLGAFFAALAFWRDEVKSGNGA